MIKYFTACCSCCVILTKCGTAWKNKMWRARNTSIHLYQLCFQSYQHHPHILAHRGFHTLNHTKVAVWHLVWVLNEDWGSQWPSVWPPEIDDLTQMITSANQWRIKMGQNARGPNHRAAEVPMVWNACQVIRSHHLISSSDHLIAHHEQMPSAWYLSNLRRSNSHFLWVNRIWDAQNYLQIRIKSQVFAKKVTMWKEFLEGVN